MFYYLPGFRTITSTKNHGQAIIEPDQLNEVVFRVPPSKTLQEFYKQAGAIPRKVPWKNVAKASARGAIDAMDPGIIGLYGGPDGVRHQVGSITPVDSVYDGWVAVISQEWFSGLDSAAKDAIKEATDKTFREHLVKVKKIGKECADAFTRMGVTINHLSDTQKQLWVERCGPHLAHWTPYKKRILGGLDIFENLIETTKTNNGYVI